MPVAGSLSGASLFNGSHERKLCQGFNTAYTSLWVPLPSLLLLNLRSRASNAAPACSLHGTVDVWRARTIARTAGSALQQSSAALAEMERQV